MTNIPGFVQLAWLLFEHAVVFQYLPLTRRTPNIVNTITVVLYAIIIIHRNLYTIKYSSVYLLAQRNKIQVSATNEQWNTYKHKVDKYL